MSALLAVQREAPKLQKDKINPGFKGSRYVSLDSLMDAVMPVLNKHGLVWYTRPGSQVDDDPGPREPVLNYTLAHVESGQTLEGAMPLMLDKQNPQGQGSAITYARRYSLMATLGLVADEDDDGNRASQRGAPSVVQGPPPYGPETDDKILVQTRSAIAFLLDVPADGEDVTAILRIIAKDAGGYLPMVAVAAVCHVAKAVRDIRPTDERVANAKRIAAEHAS